MKNDPKITITKLEQSGLLVQTTTTLLAIDIGCLSAKPPLVNRRVDGTMVSHIHPDHFHAGHIRALGAPVWTTPEVVRNLEQANMPAMLLEPGKPVTIGSFKVTPVIVDHGNISAPITNLGFVIEVDGIVVFFAGDMAVPLPFPVPLVNVLLVPVGGGKVFSAAEAANYVEANNHHNVVVPLHFHGQADPASARAFSSLVGTMARVEVLDVGESLEVTT